MVFTMVDKMTIKFLEKKLSKAFSVRVLYKAMIAKWTKEILLSELKRLIKNGSLPHNYIKFHKNFTAYYNSQTIMTQEF